MLASAEPITPFSISSLELFSGAGGLAIGSHQAGFRHRALLEWNRDACRTLTTNAAKDAVPGIASWTILNEDVRSFRFSEFGSVDFLAGGPPCQPFSIGGKHRGMSDDRNLIPQFIRAVAELRPRAFLMENVRGLLRPGFRNYFAYVLLRLANPELQPTSGETWQDHHARLEDAQTSGRLSGLRYNVVFRKLNAADYGVPQIRERVFVVGFRADTGIEWHFPEPTHSAEALFREQYITEEYWARHQLSRAPAPCSAGPLKLREAVAQRPWVTARDALRDLPSPTSSGVGCPVTNHRLQLGARAYVGHTGSPLDLPAKTLKAGDHGVPGGENMMALPDGSVRYFTVREAARLQTFPDEWEFAGAWSEAMRQLGNAVPVRLAALVAKSIFETLRPEMHA